MTKSELRQKVTETGSHYFDRKSMKFFGDTMRNYWCSRHPIDVIDNRGNPRKVYALGRNKPVKHNQVFTVYFDAETFEQVHVDEVVGTFDDWIKANIEFIKEF
jgi:hypothetical protein